MHKRSNRLFLDLIDLDFGALYPNIKMLNNMAKSSQYGRLIIPKKVSQLEYGVTPQLRGGEFIDDFETYDWLKVGIKWFGLKRATKYIEEYGKFISSNKRIKVMPIINKCGEFFKLWSTKMGHILELVYPGLNNKYFLYKVYMRDVHNTNCLIYNNYEDIEYQTTLLDTVNWIITERPILTESGTFFKRPETLNDISPGLRTLSKLKDKRGKIKAMELQYEELGDKENAKLANLGQDRTKRFMNSDYGIGGAPTSFSYNYHIAQSTTSKGQTLISMAFTTFEDFLADTISFYDTDELLHYISNIAGDKAKYNDSEYLNSNKSIEEVKERLLYKCSKIKDMDESIMITILKNLPQHTLNRLYYKSNLLKFVNDNPIIQELIYSTEVNLAQFLNPNKPPKEGKKLLSKLSDMIMDYCSYGHPWYARVERLINIKRNNVIVIDTDSNIITIHDLANTIKRYMSKNHYRTIISKDTNYEKINHEHFKAINTCAYILTDLITRTLNDFMLATNTEGHLIGTYVMKNEFYYLAMLVNSGKKRYMGKIMLREGRYLKGGKRDVKGFDFIKISSATEEVNNFIQDTLFDYIVTDKINIPKALNKFIELENKLRNSLTSGESTYLTPAKVATMDSYKNPMSTGAFKATYIWNKLYPEQEISLPNTVNLIKMDINTIKDIAGLEVDEPEIFKKLSNLLADPKIKAGQDPYTGYIPTDEGRQAGTVKTITQIAVPLDIEEIPGWILKYADFDTMVDKTMNLIIPVLEEIGITPVFKRKGDKQLSNLIEIG